MRFQSRMLRREERQNGTQMPGTVYGAIDMPWAKLVGQIAHAYGK
jgi:hypothetical protein